MTMVHVFSDVDALCARAADAVVAAAAAAQRRSGVFRLCLSGGHTPHPLYARLAQDAFADRIAWDRTQVFFGDERCVAPSDPASNYRMATDALLARVPLPRAHVHRIQGEADPRDAARSYEDVLRAELGVTAQETPARGFDLALLGMGQDGHTASLFPGSIDEPGAWVSVRPAPAGGGLRVTLLPSVFNAAHALWILVTGAPKAHVVADALCGPVQPVRLPVQRIAPSSGNLLWMLDRPAAAQLLTRVSSSGSAPPFDLEQQR